MFKRILIILSFLVAVPRLAGQELAFAGSYTQDGKPCPPECVSDSLEIVTWYPSPYNEYEELRLYPKRSSEESQCNSFEQLGLMYYNQDQQALKVCRQDPANLSYSWENITLGGGFWQLSGNDIYNTNSGGVVKIQNLKIDRTTQDGYVLTSDANGNASWKASSGGSSPVVVTGGCPSGFTTLMTQWQLGPCDSQRTKTCSPCSSGLSCSPSSTITCSDCTSCGRGPEWVSGTNNPGWTCTYTASNFYCCVGKGGNQCYNDSWFNTCNSMNLKQSLCIKN